MNEVGAQPETQTAQAVRPSSRDPIAEWLDVFTSLLALPPADRGRIRDELEDHLRMRVDDLLIVGMSEPEAVRKAVSELGETAELADRFKAARTSTRRRRIMQTALIGTASLATIFGAMTLWSSPNGSTGQAPAGQLDAAAEIEAVFVQPELDHTMDESLGAGTLGEALAAIGDNLGVSTYVHRSAFAPWGIDSETQISPLPTKGLPVSKVLELLTSELAFEGSDRVAGKLESGLLEFATQRYFDEQSIVTRHYDVSDLVPAQHPLSHTTEFALLRDGIRSVVEPSIWQSQRGGESLGAIASSGPQISVRAPERVQPMVEAYIERLRDIHRQSMEKQEREAAELREQMEQSNVRQREERETYLQHVTDKRRQLQRDLSQLLAEQESGIRDSIQTQMMLEHLQSQLSEMAPEEREEGIDELVDLRVRLETLDLERERQKNRIRTIEGRIADMENQMEMVERALSQVSLNLNVGTSRAGLTGSRVRPSPAGESDTRSTGR